MAVTASDLTSQDKPKILIVDDSKVIRLAIQNILCDKYTVIDTADGEEAWNALISNRDIDVVISDLEMPNLDGCGLLKRMRESKDAVFQNMPFIVMTSIDDSDDIKQKVYAYGADDFLSKPFESEQLLTRTKAFVRLSQAAKNSQNSMVETKQQVTIDLDTGLGTQTYFERAVDESIAYSFRRNENNCVMMLIEIDNFNNIFIKNGKDVACNIVTKIGKLFRNFVRAEDKASRMGLSKFGAFLFCGSTQRAVSLAERLHVEIINLRFLDSNNDKIDITPSIGIYMPLISKYSTFDEIFRKTEYCLKSASSSSNIKIVSNSEILDSNQPIQLSVADAIKMIQDGDVNVVNESKEQLFKQIEPLLKHIITDNKMLEKFVDELMTCLER